VHRTIVFLYSITKDTYINGDTVGQIVISSWKPNYRLFYVYANNAVNKCTTVCK